MSTKDTTSNLISFTARTEEERRAIAVKAGKASGRKRQEQKQFKELFNLLLSMKVIDEEAIDYLEKLGFKKNERTNKALLAVTTYQKALKGDMKAFELIRDTIGEMQKNEIEISNNSRINIINNLQGGKDEGKSY